MALIRTKCGLPSLDLHDTPSFVIQRAAGLDDKERSQGLDRPPALVDTTSLGGTGHETANYYRCDHDGNIVKSPQRRSELTNERILSATSSSASTCSR